MSIWDIFKKIESGENSVKGKIEYIIVGLGNFGIEYNETRHNAGFMVMDKLSEKKSFEINRVKFKSKAGETVLSDKRCLVLKPATYMNNSGEAVTLAMNFYKIPIENVIVVYDDISLEPGKLRIRRKGSDGGHNGIKSIIALTGSDAFPRIKIGVGKKPNPKYNLADWVLSKFSEDDKKALEPAFENAVNSLELIVSGNIDKAMNLYNS